MADGLAGSFWNMKNRRYNALRRVRRLLIFVFVRNQTFGATYMTETSDCFFLDLSHPFTGEIKTSSDLLERDPLPCRKTEVEIDHFSFTGRERLDSSFYQEPELIFEKRAVGRRREVGLEN